MMLPQPHHHNEARVSSRESGVGSLGCLESRAGVARCLPLANSPTNVCCCCWRLLQHVLQQIGNRLQMQPQRQLESRVMMRQVERKISLKVVSQIREKGTMPSAKKQQQQAQQQQALQLKPDANSCHGLNNKFSLSAWANLAVSCVHGWPWPRCAPPPPPP